MVLARPVVSTKDLMMKKLNAVRTHVVHGNNCFQMANVNNVKNTSKPRKLIRNSAVKTLVILRRMSIFKRMEVAKLSDQTVEQTELPPNLAAKTAQIYPTQTPAH